MASDIGFYHCTRMPVLDVAVRLTAKVYATGQRLLVIGNDEDLAALDKLLWTFADDSFLPHAITGVLDDAAQPILLAPEVPADEGNGATMLMTLGTGLPAGFEGFGRVLNLFEHGSPAHQRARDDWKALQARDGLVRSYWQQSESGKWEKRG